MRARTVNEEFKVLKGPSEKEIEEAIAKMSPEELAQFAIKYDYKELLDKAIDMGLTNLRSLELLCRVYGRWSMYNTLVFHNNHKLKESNGIPWSGKDPTKQPIIGKIMTRRTEYTVNGEKRTMKPEILEVVEKYDDYYIINKWYKPGVPQIVHDNMVNYYIPMEKYKDVDLESKTLEESLRAKFINK